jgi:hypothetical protein
MPVNDDDKDNNDTDNGRSVCRGMLEKGGAGYSGDSTPLQPVVRHD